MELKVFAVGALQSNVYLFYSQTTKEAICFDAGDEANRILKFIKDKDLKLTHIILTHGHCDHIGAAEKLRKETGAKIVIHSADVEMISDSAINLSETIGFGKIAFREDMTVEDGDTLDAVGTTLKFIHTPGHTKGSICIELGKYLVTGDTLFQYSIGRTDFYGGSMKQMYFSLKKLGAMNPDLIILPGHGDSSTIREERAQNIYMIKACKDK